MSQTFLPHPIYRWLTAVCLVLCGLLGWSLVQSITSEEIFFFVLSVGVGLWFANAMLSRVALTERAITLQKPLGGSAQVEFRQLVSVAEGGRFRQSLSVLYYPLQPDNLLDLDHVCHLLLPAVTDQEKLLTILETRILK